MPAAAPPFRISPSTIARYFFHDCERFLYYTSATPQERKRQGIPKPAFDQSPLVESILASGYQWETEVVERLLKGKVVVAGGPGELHTRRLPLAQTLRHLRREPAGRFLYQPTLAPPPDFYDTYGINPKQIVISDNHPDLIAVLPGEDGGRLLRVVDLKRGEALKLTHRVQILFYALELQAILDAEGIDARVDLDHGAVWLGKQSEPEVFDLGDFRPHLERFLRHDLGRILAGEARETHWHLYDRCEWCEFFDSCRDEMRRTDDVSRLVQLTTYGKRHLREEAGVRTLTELGTFLKRPDADEILDRCASLAGQRHRLAVRVAALETEEAQLHGAASPDLPRGENLAVFLTLQKEPLGQTIYLAGIHITGREDVRQAVFSPQVARQLMDAEAKPQPRVWLADRPEEAADVRRQFIELLDDLFRRVHHYNEGRPDWKNKLTLQAYVHTEDERALLFAALLEALQEPALAEKAMTLLFHFQGPELMQANRHPGSEVAYPVVVLQNAIGRLLALPVEVSYTLPEMLAALGSPFRYTRRDYYHFPLGHGLRAESLHAAWYRGQTDNLDEIRQQARLYLFAVAALLRAVRERAAQHLFAWPPRFTLPTGAGIREPLLSRLAFFARYESLLRCLAIREARAEARATQVLLGQVIELKAINAAEMEVVGNLIVEPETSGFPAWLLVRDNDDGRRAQVEYADYWYRNKLHGGPDSPHRVVVGVEDIHTAARGAVRLRLHYVRPFKDGTPSHGERFLLYQRFTDFTTDPIVRFLEELDQATDGDDGPAALFLQLLHHPEESATPLPLPAKVRPAVSRLDKQLALTPSQRSAFQAICRQRVTAVWGPPGTGKTHFLAATIVGLAAAHARAGLPFRVLVTAFTHAAIENLLRKIAECRASGGESGATPLLLGKAKTWQGVNPGIEVVPETDLGGWLTDGEQVILGATAYSCVKKRAELPSFDLVVIDEASQVRVPEAAIAAYLVGAEGRLVLAGDHLQLPPIIAGVYPDTPPGEPLLHRSIFEAVCPRQKQQIMESRIVRQLLENFRMNDVLTRCAADLLYGPRYQCASAKVANRRLAFTAKRGLDPLVAACLDPIYPLVVVVLDGIRASRANPIEADLIAQLVVALRDADGRMYADDAAFFRQGVFIVSPHHAQIRAIQQELATRRKWQGPPFVDTVDKMQGQEADAVLVSYGVADPEFALREAEFIYGLNRLNVAITRARCKTIVCLPRPLLEASPQVLDVEAAAVGLGFMRRLVEWIRCHGEELVFEGEDVEARVLRAFGAPVTADD
ncbi:MAG TPA: AAA domain-containing protein [Gemmataceae bacterium]|nr:AAA domain-containing protein [Gemmataceae bacterium]